MPLGVLCTKLLGPRRVKIDSRQMYEWMARLRDAVGGPRDHAKQTVSPPCIRLATRYTQALDRNRFAGSRDAALRHLGRSLARGDACCGPAWGEEGRIAPAEQGLQGSPAHCRAQRRRSHSACPKPLGLRAEAR